MYALFFGLDHAPFSIAPDPRYLFMSERHREALAHLLYGLDGGGGFVLLTGEVGTGKTTVCRCFLEQMPKHCNVAYVFNPKLTVPELLRTICDEFGVPHQATSGGVETVKDCLDPLNAFLLRMHAAGRSNVLIIDEAQNLAPDVLEQLRLLTNLETSERKLLQIVLIGQPELRALVASPQLEQLAQRVIARYHLGRLGAAETYQYIAHRMSVAGLKGRLPFQPRALVRIHALSKGVPRRINLLCDRALLGAYAAGVHEVTPAVVRKAAREVFGAGEAGGAGGRKAAWPWPALAAGALGGAAVAGALAWGAWHMAGAAPQVAPQQAAAEPAKAAVADAPAPTAAAAPTPAPAPAAAQPPAPSPLEQFLAAQPQGRDAAWGLLAQAWQAQVEPQAPQPCAELALAGLRCYRNAAASLDLLRRLDRPAVLLLQGAQQQEVPVVLRRIDGDSATVLGAQGTRLELPLAELGPLWHGAMATLWRAPEGLPDSGDITATPAGAAWLDERLRRAGVRLKAAPVRGGAVAARRARILQFQLGQGLDPDGQAGPLTLMQLNRATGVAEPRLRSGA
jgi:general secretion pathway protein A